MKHRGVEYRIIQGIKPGDWKWSVETETGTKSGTSDRKDAAVIAAKACGRSWRAAPTRKTRRPRDGRPEKCMRYSAVGREADEEPTHTSFGARRDLPNDRHSERSTFLQPKRKKDRTDLPPPTLDIPGAPFSQRCLCESPRERRINSAR